MSTRKSMFALAAIAALAASSLAPTSASAHFGGFHRSWGHDHDHDRDRGSFHMSYNHFHWWPPHPGCWSWCRWHPRYRFGGGAVSPVVSAASAPAAVPASAPAGGCLSKRELPDGDALFKDNCTGEKAESQPQGGNPGGR
jgi:hypothetical protein